MRNSNSSRNGGSYRLPASYCSVIVYSVIDICLIFLFIAFLIAALCFVSKLKPTDVIMVCPGRNIFLLVSAGNELVRLQTNLFLVTILWAVQNLVYKTEQNQFIVGGKGVWVCPGLQSWLPWVACLFISSPCRCLVISLFCLCYHMLLSLVFLFLPISDAKDQKSCLRNIFFPRQLWIASELVEDETSSPPGCGIWVETSQKSHCWNTYTKATYFLSIHRAGCSVT